MFVEEFGAAGAEWDIDWGARGVRIERREERPTLDGFGRWGC